MGKNLLHVLWTLFSISHTFSGLVITVFYWKTTRAIVKPELCPSASSGDEAAPWHFLERYDVSRRVFVGSLFNL
jgi:hypothetical protein